MTCTFYPNICFKYRLWLSESLPLSLTNLGKIGIFWAAARKYLRKSRNFWGSNKKIRTTCAEQNFQIQKIG